MSKRFQFALLSSSLLLILAACGNSSDTGSSQNNNPGTSTGGPVSIGTDHSTYKPTDTINISVTNHLSTSIFAYDTRASCTILDLQMQVNGVWQDTQIARCSLGRPAMLVETPAMKAYTAKITAGSPGVIQATFPPGTYRLLLTYSTSRIPMSQQSSQNTTTIYSANFAVTSSS